MIELRKWIHGERTGTRREIKAMTVIRKKALILYQPFLCKGKNSTDTLKYVEYGQKIHKGEKI